MLSLKEPNLKVYSRLYSLGGISIVKISSRDTPINPIVEVSLIALTIEWQGGNILMNPCPSLRHHRISVPARIFQVPSTSIILHFLSHEAIILLLKPIYNYAILLKVYSHCETF